MRKIIQMAVLFAALLPLSGCGNLADIFVNNAFPLL
jgi:hypothetical protein